MALRQPDGIETARWHPVAGRVPHRCSARPASPQPCLQHHLLHVKVAHLQLSSGSGRQRWGICRRRPRPPPPAPDCRHPPCCCRLRYAAGCRHPACADQCLQRQPQRTGGMQRRCRLASAATLVHPAPPCRAARTAIMAAIMVAPIWKSTEARRSESAICVLVHAGPGTRSSQPTPLCACLAGVASDGFFVKQKQGLGII